MMKAQFKTFLLLACVIAAAWSQPTPAFKPQYTQTFNGDKLVFAVIGDWGRYGGEGSDGTVQACLDQVKINMANNLNYDLVSNACGALEQVTTAKIMDRACGKKGCQFVINTSDNFYVDGCWADNTTTDPKKACSNRFITDWVNIYQTEKTPNLLNLPWIGSLGNHDVLGLKAGIDAQIAYSQENNNWVLPARYYTADVNASAGPSVRIHTAYTSCWVSSYRKSTSSMSRIDEIMECSTPEAVAAQINFLNESMSTSTADWDIVLAHHPAFSSGWESYFDVSERTKTADGWTPFAELVQKLQPAAYFNGHDHAMNYAYVKVPINNISGVNVPYSFPYTGFHTSGAGSFTQAQAGGFGLPAPMPFTAYTNVDIDRGVAPGGFNIVTVTKDKFVVEYYSNEHGSEPTFIVVTENGGLPQAESLNLVRRDIVWDPAGESISFGRKLV